MRDLEQTIGNLIDKSNLTIISYVDNEGFPISKAMLSPREREGIKIFWTAQKGRYYSNFKSENFDI